MQSTRSLRVRPLDVFRSGCCSFNLLTDVNDDEDIFIGAGRKNTAWVEETSLQKNQ